MSKAFRLTVSGDFDENEVPKMSRRLRKFGSVEKRFFFPRMRDRDAAVQFTVLTVHDAAELKAVLERTSGVRLVNVGANDA